MNSKRKYAQFSKKCSLSDGSPKQQSKFHKKMMYWMKSSFFLMKKIKVKPIESYKSRERYQADIILFKTMSEMDLNISLQWWIIS